jgi:hypothetical protein
MDGGMTSMDASELSRRLAAERLRTETLERRLAECEEARKDWQAEAGKLMREGVGLTERRDAARAEAEKQIRVKMMFSEHRELFLRALQSIASEPCASRLVSGRECDMDGSPCARCKAKKAIRESEKSIAP